jgi:hypothetical protein
VGKPILGPPFFDRELAAGRKPKLTQIEMAHHLAMVVDRHKLTIRQGRKVWDQLIPAMKRFQKAVRNVEEIVNAI